MTWERGTAVTDHYIPTDERELPSVIKIEWGPEFRDDCLWEFAKEHANGVKPAARALRSAGRYTSQLCILTREEAAAILVYFSKFLASPGNYDCITKERKHPFEYRIRKIHLSLEDQGIDPEKVVSEIR